MIRALADGSIETTSAGPARHERIGYRIGLACVGLFGILSVALTELAGTLTIPITLMVTSVIAAMLSLLPRRSLKRGVLPHWLIAGVSLLAFGFAFYEIQILGASTVSGLAHFFSCIVIIKLLDRDGARDNAELLVTSLFLMVIGAIVSGHMIFALILAAYVWVGIRTLSVFHLKCESERIEALASGEKAGAKVFAAQYRRPGQARAGVTYFTVGTVVSVGILIFLLVPRVGAGMFGPLQSPVALALTGFSDTVSFGDIGEIKKSSAPVMRVELLIDGQPIGSPSFQPYFRGMTLDAYDGRQWRATGNSRPIEISPGAPLVPAYRPTSRDRILEQRIKLLAPATVYLFAAYLPFTVEFDVDRTVRTRTSDRALFLSGRTLPKPMSYTVHSLLQIRPELSALLNPPVGSLPSWARSRPNRSAGRNNGFRLRRVTSQRVRDYADALVADLPLPNDPKSIRALAKRIETHLLSGEFEYTLERGDVDPDREAVEDFLFYRKRGHCEYFATSMAVMCQLAGINARIVHGYRGGEWNATGNYYLVREEHAHSWVEVHAGDDDWVRFDPTPGGVNVDYDSNSIWNAARGMYEHLNAMWAENVVAYNATSRDNMLEAFGTWLTELGQHGSLGKEAYYAAKELLLGPAALKLGYRLLYWVAIALILLVFYLSFKMAKRPARLWWRWIARVTTANKRRPRQEAFYARTLDLLAEMGFPKKDSATPLEFMSRLAQSDDRFAALPDVARAFYQIHFGGRPLSPDQRRGVQRIIGKLADVSRLG